MPEKLRLSVSLNSKKIAVIEARSDGNAGVIVTNRNVRRGDSRPDAGVTIVASGVSRIDDGSVLLFEEWITETLLAVNDEVRIRVVTDEPATPALRTWSETQPPRQQ